MGNSHNTKAEALAQFIGALCESHPVTGYYCPLVQASIPTVAVRQARREALWAARSGALGALQMWVEKAQLPVDEVKGVIALLYD